MTDPITSPKKLFTVVKLLEKEVVYYLGIEVAYLDSEHEQIYFASVKHGFDCEQLIDLANMLKILHLKL